MPQISTLFAVPFGFGRHPRPEPLNTALRELFIAREAEGARWANPNPYTIRNAQLFESHFDLFTWPEPCINELRRFCLGELLRLVGEINGYDEASLQRIDIATDAWFHITRSGGHFGVHNHPMAAWSGVYCVSPGRHDPAQTDSGRLSFINPYSTCSMYLDAGNAQQRNPYQFSNYGFDLVPGQLVLFPSWVLHHVMPFYGQGERITVAFNCSFRLRAR
ncbi:MAG: hypothetical protein JSS45_08750 [Proteobacteria bacterium]|nr:hypothetical protein [Pseudomonadota bacterium]